MNQLNGQEDHLNEVLADYLVRTDRGEKVSRSELIAAHPEIAEELREHFADSDAIVNALEDTDRRVDETLVLPLVLGDYQLFEKLGSGGMGVVYKARQTRLARIVAVKVFPRDRIMRPEAIARFQREMLAVGVLDHPNIVRAHDAREVDGTHFLVMEYIEGLDLDRVIRLNGPLAIPDACEIIRQTALGLEHVHKKALVHRDIKPSNLMLTMQGVVKILDLGLARLHEDIDNSIESTADHQGASGPTELTGHGQVLGTANYMAPEQAVNTHGTDIRADIYSLGCTFYRLLTGQAPFPAQKYFQLTKTTAEHARDSAMALQRARPEIPRELLALVERMLAWEPTDRPGTPGEVAAAVKRSARGASLSGLLRRIVGGDTTQLPSAPSEDTPDGTSLSVSEEAHGFQSKIQVSGRSVFRRPKTLVALAVGALAVLGAIFAIATDYGTLEIKTLDDHVKVAVSQGGRRVTIVDTMTNNSVDLRSGQYEVQLADGKDGWTLSTDKFVLHRGDHAIVEVKLAAPTSPSDQGSGQSPASGEIARFRKTIVLKTGFPGCLVFSPDGRTLAAASKWNRDPAITLFDTSSLTVRRLLKGHPSGTNSIAFSPDGRSLASAGDPGIALWDLTTGLSRPLLSRFGTFTELDGKTVTFATDGSTLVFTGTKLVSSKAGPDGKKQDRWQQTLKRWDFKTNRETLSLDLDRELIALSPDGKLLATVDRDEQIKLLDSETGRKIVTFTGKYRPEQLKAMSRDDREEALFESRCASLAFSPDGKTLAGSGEKSGVIRLWDMETHHIRTVLHGHTNRVGCIGFSPDGTLLASCSQDKTIVLWDTQTYRRLQTLDGRSDYLDCMAFSPDSRLLAVGSRMQTVTLWDIYRRRSAAMATANRQDDETGADRVTASGKREFLQIADVLLTLGGTLTVCTEGNEQQISSSEALPKREFDIVEIRFSNNPFVHDQDIMPLKRLSSLRSLVLHRTNVTDAVVEPLSELSNLMELDLSNTVIGNVGAARLESMKSLQQINVKKTHVTKSGVDALQKALPNCRIIHDGNVAHQAIEEVYHGRRIAKNVFEPSWSPDGRRIVVDSDSGLQIIDVGTGASSELLSVGGSPAWSPGQGRWIAFTMGGEGHTEVWIVNTSGEKNPRKIGEGGRHFWSLDGETLFFVHNKTDTFVFVRPGEGNVRVRELFEPPVKMQYLQRAPMLRSEKQITFRQQNEIGIIDKDTGKEAAPIRLPFIATRRPWAVLLTAYSWSPDGKQMVLAYSDRNDDDMDREDGVAVYNVETKTFKTIAPGSFHRVAWSPDGSRIAIGELRPENGRLLWDLWVVETKHLGLADQGSPPFTETKAKPAHKKPDGPSMSVP